ncbi:MAG: hypothetical protein M3Z22_06620 [Verrucomicrobiota bacterium]|nr:hypothetical protein [Verrucomicrobiota bacterium]
MFPLHTKTFPASASAFEELLNASLREVLTLRGDAVTVRGAQFPLIDEIAIELIGATLRPNPPKPRPSVAPGKPALEVKRLTIRGENVPIGPAKANLALAANGVRLGSGLDANSEIVLNLDAAADGSVEISATKSDIESAIAEFAKREAEKQGVSIEDVRLTLRESGARAVEAEAVVRARKLFFTAVVRIAASLRIDDEMNATLSGVQCHGEGAIGSMACSFLEPHLAKVNGRTLSLMGLALGGIRLRDVRLAAGDTISVRAEFGA